MAHENYTASADVLAAHLPGEAVLLDMETKNYFRLNETAAWIWRSSGTGPVARTQIICRGSSFSVVK